MNRLRTLKQSHVNVVRAYVKAGYLTDAEAKGFESMFRKCRSQEEQRQVSEALREFMNYWKTGTDAYSRLIRDDILGDDDLVMPRLQRESVVLELQGVKKR